MSKKHTYNYVKQFIEDAGYTLISNTYVNTVDKLLLRCPNGHNYITSFRSFKNSGNRCSTCFDNNRTAPNKLTYEHVKHIVESKGLTLISKYYKEAHSKLLVGCKNGHEYEVSYANITQDKKCPYCVGTKRHYLDSKRYIESEGYKLLSKTTNGRLEFICPEGHIFYTTFWNFKQNQRCISCSNLLRGSKGENEVASFVESLGIPIVKNDRTQIVNPKTGHNLELDIWIPSMRKAIEYNGTYWHSIKNNDMIKNVLCENQGIDLLTIKEDMWINNTQMEMRRVKNWLS